MTERLIGIGPESRLAGLLGMAPETAPPRLGMVLLSPGLLHRVGNSRVNVLLARQLVASGFPTLRFDFSGNGDSPRRHSVPRTFESAIEEVLWAAAALREATGVQDVVLYGHCSGADVAQRAAVHDASVTGLVLSDPIVFRTTSFLFRRYAPRLLRPEVLLRVPQTLVRMSRPPANPDWVRMVPDRSILTDELCLLAKRRTRLLAIFTGGARDSYAYEGQYRAAFRRVPFGDLLTERLIVDADHTLSAAAPRQALIEAAKAFVVNLECHHSAPIG